MNTENLYIKQIMIGPMMNYGYLVGDKSSKEAAVIDPGFECSKLIDEAKKDGLKITNVLATHTHFDHVGEIPRLTKGLSVPVYVHKNEAHLLKEIDNLIEIEDGDKIKIGGLEFGVLLTPGHSPGSVCYRIDDAIFTGDTLFVDGIGRTDLAGGDVEQMYNSLRRLCGLPDKTVVYPGHHYGPSQASTIGEQKKTNPYLHSMPLADFFRIA